MNLLVLGMALVLLAVLQASLPTLGWLGGLRLELLPALVAYAALSLPQRRWALGLAFGAGLTQDCLSAGPFGLSALAYLAAAWLLTRLTHSFDREALWMQMLGAALASVAVSLGALTQVGLAGWALAKLAALALLSALLAPLLFGLLDAMRWRRHRA